MVCACVAYTAGSRDNSAVDFCNVHYAHAVMLGTGVIQCYCLLLSGARSKTRQHQCTVRLATDIGHYLPP